MANRRKNEPPGIIPGILSLGLGGEENVIGSLYFSEDNYDLIRMKQLTELDPSQVMGLAVLSLIQRKFRLKNLRWLQEEIYLHEKSKDRQGIDEFLELNSAIRRASAGEDSE